VRSRDIEEPIRRQDARRIVLVAPFWCFRVHGLCEMREAEEETGEGCLVLRVDFAESTATEFRISWSFIRWNSWGHDKSESSDQLYRTLVN
jgi:hypothetical protein